MIELFNDNGEEKAELTRTRSDVIVSKNFIY